MLRFVPVGVPVLDVVVVVVAGRDVVELEVVVVAGRDVVVVEVVVTGRDVEAEVVLPVVGVLPPGRVHVGLLTVPDEVPCTPTEIEAPAAMFAPQSAPVTVIWLPDAVALAPQAEDTPTLAL